MSFVDVINRFCFFNINSFFKILEVSGKFNVIEVFKNVFWLGRYSIVGFSVFIGVYLMKRYLSMGEEV